MPAKRKKFESTFPAARIKRIMQLDDDVGRVASSVPIVISRALEIFLHAVLTRANEFAVSRSAKTLTVGHIKYCIEREKQWDFLKDLTAKLPEVNVSEEMQGAPKRGRKRRGSASTAGSSGGSSKAKVKKESSARVGGDLDEEEEEDSDSEDASDNTSMTSSPHSRSNPSSSSVNPSPLALLQHQMVSSQSASKTVPVSAASSSSTTLSPLAKYTASLSNSKPAAKTAPAKASPLLAYTSKLQSSGTVSSQSTTTSDDSMARTMEKIASLVKPQKDFDSDEDYDS